MSIRQTNSTITYLLSSYHAVFQAAYGKGLSSTLVAVLLTASIPAFSAQTDVLVPYSSAYSLAVPTALVPAAAPAAAAPGATAAPAVAAAQAPTYIELLNQNTPDIITISHEHAALAQTGNSLINLQLNNSPDKTPQYFFYLPGSNTTSSTFVNNGTIIYDWTQNDPAHKDQVVAVAAVQAGSYAASLSNNGTITINGYSTLNNDGADPLDNVALKIEGLAVDNNSVSASLFNLQTGIINVTNATGMKILATNKADLPDNLYSATNEGTINVTLNDNLNITSPNLIAAGMRFYGPTNGTAGRYLNNQGTIQVATAANAPNTAAYGAGIVVDSGADRIIVNQSGTINASDGNYAIYVGTYLKTGVNDATRETRINLGKDSVINGAVRLNHNSILNLEAGNKDSFVLTSYSELIRKPNADASFTIVPQGTGIFLSFEGDNDLALESGSDVSVVQFSDTAAHNSNTLQINDGSSLKFVLSDDDININNTHIINQGSLTVTGGQRLLTTRAPISNDGSLTVTEGSTLNVSGELFDNNGTIGVNSGSKLLIASDKFVNQGTLNINQGTLGFRSDSITAPVKGQAVAHLLDLGTVTTTDTVFELLSSPAFYVDPDDLTGTPEPVLNALELYRIDEMGSGNKIKLNNHTAVSLTGEDTVSNQYFTSGFIADTTDPSSDPDTRNIYFGDFRVNYSADHNHEIIAVPNATVNFSDLNLISELTAPPAANNTVTITSGSNIAVSNSLISNDYDTVAVSGSARLTLDTGRLSPGEIWAHNGSDNVTYSISGTISTNLTVTGNQAVLNIAAADQNRGNHWIQDTGKSLALQSGGQLNLGQYSMLSTESLAIGDTSQAVVGYDAALHIRGDHRDDTVNLIMGPDGTLNNLGTVDLGYGNDTIGIRVDPATGALSHSMGHGIDGGGHIVVDLSQVTDLFRYSYWDDLNRFAQDLSNDNGNVEIRGVDSLPFPTRGRDPETGYTLISAEDIFIHRPIYLNLNFETTQTKDAVLLDINNTDLKLFGGGWRGIKAADGLNTITTTKGSHTNIYGDADSHNNIAVNEQGQRIGVDLAPDSTLNILSNGRIGAITGQGTFQVTGDNGQGTGGKVEVLDPNNDSRFADITSERLVAVNGAAITAENFQTQGTIENSTLTAQNNLYLTSESQLTQAELNAGNNLRLDSSSTVTNSSFNVAGTMTMGTGSRLDAVNITADSGLITGSGYHKTSFNKSSVLHFAQDFNIGTTSGSTGTTGTAGGIASGTMVEFTDNTQVTAQSINIKNAQIEVTGNALLTADELNLASGAVLHLGREPDSSLLSRSAAASAADVTVTDNGCIEVDVLNALAGSTISLDPSAHQPASVLNARTLKDNTLQGRIAVGRNSVMGVGFASDELGLCLDTEQVTADTGAVKEGYGAVLALNEAVKLDHTAGIRVDGNGTHSDDPVDGNNVTLKNQGTLLVTDKAFSRDGKTAVITFTDTANKGTVISDGGQILLSGVFNGADTYNLFDNADVSQAAELTLSSANGLFTGKLDENGDFKLTFNAPGGGERIFNRASLPVDKMLQQAFTSEDHSAGTAFLQSIASSGMGRGIEAERPARLAVYAGAVQAALAASDAAGSTVHSRLNQYHMDGRNTGKMFSHGNSAMWLTPTIRSIRYDGFEAEGVRYGTDLTLYGLSIGADHVFDRNIIVGVALNSGSGSVDGKDTGAGATNDFTYLGASLYAGTEYDTGTRYGCIRLGADITYTQVDSDLESDSGLENYGKLKSTTLDQSISLGLNAALSLEQWDFKLVPHAGLRYTGYFLDDYSVESAQGTIADIEQEQSHIISFPLGITIHKDITSGDWNLKPHADLTLTANMGDTDFGSTANFGSNHARLSTECMDKFTYALEAGIDLNHDNFSLGARARYTGSVNTDEYSLSLNGSYRF